MRWHMKGCCLEDACKKIFRKCRMFAMFPLNDDCQFSLKFSIAPALIFFTMSIHCIYWIYEGKNIIILRRTFFHQFLYIFRKVNLTFSCILIVSQLVSERDKLRLILNNLKKIDSELTLLNKKPMIVLGPIKYLINIFICIFIIIGQLPTNHPVYWMKANVETLLVAVFINQIFAFFELFKYSLEQISTFSCFAINRDYTKLTRLYNVIEDCVEIFNNIYGLGMFFIITTFFITVLHQLYQYLSFTTNIFHQLSLFCTATGYSLLILQIILACNIVASKASIFNSNLYNKLSKIGCNNISNLEEIYFHFERVKEFRIPANGFFVVDQKLICSLIITGTTYLVIFLQYSK